MARMLLFFRRKEQETENVQAVQRILRRLREKKVGSDSKRKRKLLEDVPAHMDEVGYEASSLQFQTTPMKGKGRP